MKQNLKFPTSRKDQKNYEEVADAVVSGTQGATVLMTVLRVGADSMKPLALVKILRRGLMCSCS